MLQRPGNHLANQYLQNLQWIEALRMPYCPNPPYFYNYQYSSAAAAAAAGATPYIASALCQPPPQAPLFAHHHVYTATAAAASLAASPEPSVSRPCVPSSEAPASS